MITGSHLLLYSADADADRAFFRDTLGFRSVDAGGGWLILALPPAELGVHPAESGQAGQGMPTAELYLMCDDLDRTMAELAGKGVACGAIENLRWGRRTDLRLPSGARLGLYQPLHPTAIEGLR